MSCVWAGDELADETMWLRVDYSVQCWQGAHMPIIAYAILMILVFPFGARRRIARPVAPPASPSELAPNCPSAPALEVRSKDRLLR